MHWNFVFFLWNSEYAIKFDTSLKKYVKNIFDLDNKIFLIYCLNPRLWSYIYAKLT